MGAEPLVDRCSIHEGFVLARLATQLRPAAVVVGSRGLAGTKAMMDSVSDSIVHCGPSPVLVIPQALLSAERSALQLGPVIVAHDGSSGAERALTTAMALFGERPIVVVSAGSEAVEESALVAAGAVDAESVAVELPGMQPHSRAVAGAVASYAAQRQAALVVVGSRGQSTAPEIVLGSVAVATLHHGHRPVLVVPDPRRH